MTVLFFGIISGVISGMGLGGGVTMIPLLTIFAGLGQHEAQSVNLFYFLPTGAAALIVHIKEKNIDLKSALSLLPLGILSALGGASLAAVTEGSLLKKIFGCFLIVFGSIEIFNAFTNREK